MPRVDYDRIAHLYDAQPHRARTADPDLLALAEQRRTPGPAVLDIGCGTGNQLIADSTALPEARCCGCDRSLGMLRQAHTKAPHLSWVCADAARLPFPATSFDYVTCEFAFHHIADKWAALRDVYRVLRPGGRFVMRNLCPQESPDWLCYEYFPQARRIDLRDFWPPDRILAALNAAGFVATAASHDHLRFEQNLVAWLAVVRRRDTCSQLQAISEAAYRAGVHRVESDVADPNGPVLRLDRLCLVTVRAAAPDG